MTRREWFAAMLAKAPERTQEQDERAARLLAQITRENEAWRQAQTISTRE